MGAQGRPDPQGGVYAVLCALPEELGSLGRSEGVHRSFQGLELSELELGGVRLRTCVAGVGKVRAAHGTAALLGPGDVEALFVVGTCGALSPELSVGDMVHCLRTAQVDFALREDREHAPSREWSAAWQGIAPGPGGWFLTADRPVSSWWRRRRLARAYLAGRGGIAVADMETAAAAAVCQRAGVPWAGLRAVTDGADPWSGLSFRRNLPIQGPRAADTLAALLGFAPWAPARGDDVRSAPDFPSLGPAPGPPGPAPAPG